MFPTAIRNLTTDPTDPELLRRFASDRDSEAFAEIVDRYYAAMSGIGRRVVGDAHEAEDIAQATFVLLAERAPHLTRRDGAGIARRIIGVAYRLAKIVAGRWDPSPGRIT